MSDVDDRAKLIVEVWKKTVDVQQHFNDLEMRIRNFALTLLVGVLGGTAFALEKGGTVRVGYAMVPLASALMAAGALAWAAFYLLDRHWYHRLLVGAVIHGQAIEKDMPELPLGLTHAIREQSQIRMNRFWISAVILLPGLLLWRIVNTLLRWKHWLGWGSGTLALIGSVVLAALFMRWMLLTTCPEPGGESCWMFKARHRIDLFYGVIWLVLVWLAILLTTQQAR